MDKLIIAIDPGGTTGIAVMRLTDDAFELIETQQVGDPDIVWKHILDLIVHFKAKYDDVFVICESFELRPDVVSPDETPKFIIKDLNRYVEPDHEINYRMASQAKVGVAPGKNGRADRLKAFGLFQRGNRHANDAIRHIVSYALEKLHHRPLQLAGWPLPGKK